MAHRSTCPSIYTCTTSQRYRIHRAIPLLVVYITVLDTISWFLFAGAMIENRSFNKAYWAYQDATNGRGRWQDRPTYPPLNERDRDGNFVATVLAFIYPLIYSTLVLPPTHLLLCSKRLHPVYILVVSILGFGASLSGGVLMIILLYYAEMFNNGRDKFAFDELMMSVGVLYFVVAVLWFLCMCVAARAVRCWRKLRRGERGG